MLPSIVRPFLWSYNLDALDLERDKKRIVTNVLKLGSKKATDWLFETYSREDIIECIENPLPGELDKKSLNYWALVLGVDAGDTRRIVPA